MIEFQFVYAKCVFVSSLKLIHLIFTILHSLNRTNGETARMNEKISFRMNFILHKHTHTSSMGKKDRILK